MLRNIIAQLKKIISYETFFAINLHIPSSNYNDWSYFDFCFFCKYVIKTMEKQEKERAATVQKQKELAQAKAKHNR